MNFIPRILKLSSLWGQLEKTGHMSSPASRKINTGVVCDFVAAFEIKITSKGTEMSTEWLCIDLCIIRLWMYKKRYISWKKVLYMSNIIYFLTFRSVPMNTPCGSGIPSLCWVLGCKLEIFCCPPTFCCLGTTTQREPFCLNFWTGWWTRTASSQFRTHTV